MTREMYLSLVLKIHESNGHFYVHGLKTLRYTSRTLDIRRNNKLLPGQEDTSVIRIHHFPHG